MSDNLLMFLIKAKLPEGGLVMEESKQLSLFSACPLTDAAVEVIRKMLRRPAQPSAWELLRELERLVEPRVRWVAIDAIRRLVGDHSLTDMQRSFLLDLLGSEDLAEAIRGKVRPGREVESTIDALVRESAAYRTSAAFQETVSFMANFRNYSPFNNMLVRIQNPSCDFYATQSDWERRFNRRLKEDAHPMLILAPMRPVMLVYDLDQTDGPPLPEEIRQFGKYAGEWDPQRLALTIENAWERDHIRVAFKTLSSTTAGFVALERGHGDAKMRIVIHEEHDPPSRYGVLCHELAHVYLGHLGGDPDGWWPSRGNLNRNTLEIEAEAVAYITTRRAGMAGASARYISRYLDNDGLLASVSLDQIAKVAGRLEEMANRQLPKRRVREGGQKRS